jgi:hypothetical protein
MTTEQHALLVAEALRERLDWLERAIKEGNHKGYAAASCRKYSEMMQHWCVELQK